MAWDRSTIDSQVLAVHAAVQNFDALVYFGGDEFDPEHAKRGAVDATCLFDADSGGVSRIGSPTKLSSSDLFDAFCSGHALTVNGTLMVAGGTEGYPGSTTGLHKDHFPGLRDTAIFRYDGSASGWKATASLNFGARSTPDARDTGGRWYPSLLTLANGDVIAISGHPAEGDREHINYIPEVFTPTPTPHGEWHRLGSYDDPQQDQLFKQHQTDHYPRAHLLPTGDIVLASPTLGPTPKTVTLTVQSNPWSASFATVCKFTPQPTVPYLAWAPTSVLLPLLHERNYQTAVLLAGDEQAWMLNLDGWQPGVTIEDTLAWRPTTQRKLAGTPRRINGNAVILPTGEILFVGGVEGQVSASGELSAPDSTAVLTPEIFNPFTSSWSALTSASERAVVPRNYHSVALLLRDGRVWTAGSNHDGLSPALPGGGSELRIEIYEPWYYRRPNRPDILAAPDRWRTGEQFVVRTTQAQEIKRVVLVRCGSCTHAFNPDQRYITLRYDYKGGDELLVDAPPHGNVSPSGMYFLYTINRSGLPSDGITLFMSSDPKSDDEKNWDALYRGS